MPDFADLIITREQERDYQRRKQLAAMRRTRALTTRIDGVLVFNWVHIAEQSEEWVDAVGVYHRIPEMGPGYRRRAANFFIRRAGRLVMTYYLRELSFALDPGNPLGPSGDAATLAVEQEHSDILNHLYPDLIDDGNESHGVEEWCSRLPVVRALRADL